MAHLIFLSSAFQGLKNKGRLEIFSLRKQRGGSESTRCEADVFAGYDILNVQNFSESQLSLVCSFNKRRRYS